MSCVVRPVKLYKPKDSFSLGDYVSVDFVGKAIKGNSKNNVGVFAGYLKDLIWVEQEFSLNPETMSAIQLNWFFSNGFRV